MAMTTNQHVDQPQEDKAAQTPPAGRLGDAFAGRTLYGDDFDEDGIRKWFEEEQSGYFEISDESQKNAEYVELNRVTLFEHVNGKKFDSCVALGCAAGFDVEALAPQVGRFVCVEPSEEFWRSSIGSAPADYRKPTLRGKIDLPASSIELFTAICVLHHIPNVGDIFSEAHRVLKPGGYLLVREPIVSMGDWRRSRRSLTKNERGLPAPWVLSALTAKGFTVKSATYATFWPWIALCNRFGIDAYRHKWSTYIDLALSALSSWNSVYHRTSFLRKFAPSTLSVVAVRGND